MSLLVGAAALAAAAAALAAGRAPAPAEQRRPPRDRGSVVGAADDPASLRRRARIASLVAAAAAWLLVGGRWGVVAGVTTAVVLPHLLGRLEPARARRERVELVRAAPLVADLMAAALSAGVPAQHALGVVARAVGGVAGDLLGQVQRRMELGEAPELAWAAVAARPGLGGIARAVARSSSTGAPLAAQLATAAVELRAQAAAAAMAEVRAASVRAVLPLGLCLLPSFGLLGIVPVVAGLLPAL